ncbi:hypothetical protein [Litchfieldella xinjiangensis]|uniref:hypothetical protein n=1 Tax=Litchfieldella xinjiangensis TaxID=1166948 RepID=UPI0005BA4CD6|nr:hypothetical protein [Halomonas xinjiangensis]
MAKLPLRLMLLLLAIVSAGIIGQHTQLSVLALQRIDPLPEAKAMIEEERYAEAADYMSFFMTYEYVSSRQEAQSLYQAINEHRSQWRYQLSKLGEGLLEGTSDETIGQATSVMTDFMVIGDIRDLASQGVNYAQGEEVDEVMVALASLGFIASSAQLASGLGTAATAGTGAPALAGTTIAKSSIIAMKAARRLGKLPSWLGKAVLSAAKSASETRSLGALGNMLGDINTLAKTRGGLKLLARTQNATDLHRAARFADAFGSKSATLYRIGGNTAIDIAQRSSVLGKETILMAATFGQGGLKLLNNTGAIKFTKYLSRGSKMIYKGDLVALIAKLLLLLPIWLLYALIALTAWLWFPSRLLTVLCKRIVSRAP